MKNLGLRALVLALPIAFAGSAVLAAEYTLNVNTALTTTDPLYKGLTAFQQMVAKDSGGKLQVKLFPNSQLGPDEDVMVQARSGAPVAVIVDGGRLANYTKAFGILGAPYLASGYKGIRKVVTSPLFDGWAKDLHDQGKLQVLSFNWWQGERELWTNVKVTKPSDLKGVRMRTPGAPVWTETVRAMGATPTPMPWADTYSALQQKAIDAAEAQLPAGEGSKLYEVTHYLTMTGHINLITGMITSAKWYDSLPKDLQKVLTTDALKAGDIGSYATKDSLAALEKTLKKQGMEVDHIDTAPFKKATEVVYEKLGYGKLHAEVEKILAQ
ncbi:C4-dicarboxylate TRAP transporter substrate-binding protein [Solirhodobacter olei]|uniref:C4-dicarboxylate TRAP transporter substrate-binding protein n=1 Tax=Solirhodobacter olei TaxID=2493082 RepID=UPI000FDC23E9|nr:C4-dicarboxylate TRAP transporter substrate-binding protein [Solirhodobacter olei]